MERSAIREIDPQLAIPDFAALHPGYGWAGARRPWGPDLSSPGLTR
jgi:hypothetical protein